MTLFERVVGLTQTEDGSEKIAIHVIQSLMVELGAGRITVEQCAAIMNLDQPQTTDFIRVLTAAQSATNAPLFAQRVFAHLLLGENAGRSNGSLDSYLDEPRFWSMVETEAAK